MTMLAGEKLTSEMFEVTTGLLLGDGNLQRPSGCKYYRLRFTQNSIRKDYVLHLFYKYKNGLLKGDDRFELIKASTPRT